jgi:hypothetical protein
MMPINFGRNVCVTHSINVDDFDTLIHTICTAYRGAVMNDINRDNVYRKLGVRPIINAVGKQTIRGGSTPSPLVRKAMEEADTSFVDMEELLSKSGDHIASLLGVEAAYITAGCSQ